VLTPTFTGLRIEGRRRHLLRAEVTAAYPDHSIWPIVSLVTLRDGKVSRQRTHFAQPFEPPAWRSEWVELS
jgi:hypothetical protein